MLTAGRLGKNKYQKAVTHKKQRKGCGAAVVLYMGIIPILRAHRLVSVLIRVGFKIVRQAGSHVHLEHITDKTRKITIPMHNGDLPIKTLLSILKQARISLSEFLNIIGRKR